MSIDFNKMQKEVSENKNYLNGKKKHAQLGKNPAMRKGKKRDRTERYKK